MTPVQPLQLQEADKTRKTEFDDAAGRQEEYPHIGPWHQEIENTNGALLRKFCEQTGMVATNTWKERKRC